MAEKKKKKKGKQLTGLAAALVKSGHISEKKAKKLAREQRRDDKALGREAVAERDEQKQAEHATRQEAEAAAARERERQRAAEEARERALRVIRDNLAPSVPGRRRWFFVARDRRILYLELGDETARLLGQGEAGIVESLGEGAGQHVVVHKRAVTTLLGLDKEYVRFWNREGPPVRPQERERRGPR